MAEWTQARHEAARAREAAATAGPWKGCAHINGVDCPCGFAGDIWAVKADQVVCTMGLCQCVEGADMIPTNPSQYRADGQFIAAARNDHADMLDEIERQHSDLAALRRTVEAQAETIKELHYGTDRLARAYLDCGHLPQENELAVDCAARIIEELTDELAQTRTDLARLRTAEALWMAGGAELKRDLAEARAALGRYGETLDVPHLLEVATKRCEDRSCEHEDNEETGEICHELCESMADYCDPCLIAQLIGTVEDAQSALRGEEAGP